MEPGEHVENADNAGNAGNPEDDELEVTPLDQPPARRERPSRLGRFGQRLAHVLRRRRSRIALAICAIALAVIAPLASLAATRALPSTPQPTPTQTPMANAPLTIVSVATTSTDISPTIWDSLRARPLRLPTLAPGAACPTAQGRNVAPAFGPATGIGPVYIVGLGTDGVLQATAPVPNGAGSSSWGNQFAFFVIAPSYQGPALARGRQLDGQHALLFNGGLDQISGFTATTPTLLSQLRLEGSPAYGTPWPNFGAYLRMQAPGCYGIQIDGVNFSEVIVFRVVFGQ